MKASKPLKQRTLFDTPSSPIQYQSSPSTKSRRGGGVTTGSPFRKRSRTPDSDDEISAIKLAPAATAIPDQPSSDDDDAPQRVNASRKRRKVRVVSASESESELLSHTIKRSPSASNLSEDVGNPAPSKRSRLQRRKSPVQQASSDEDVAQLANEVDEERILDTRFRTRNRSAFQKNLEKLKRRKLKLEDDDEEEEEEDEEEEEEISAKPFKGSKPSSGLGGVSDGEQSDSSTSSGFIVEDDSSVQLPAEFSMETHQDLSHQFKKIFQFFVHVAVQPTKSRADFMEARIRDEQYFSVPLQVTRRKLSGLRDSLVSSSVWRPEFKRSLENYPDFELVALDFAMPSCDACHLGGRMSTLLGRLSGCQYNKFGFKPKTPPRSEEREGKEFHLGRFCARRTRVFHEFSHWEHSLFRAILREIDGLRNAKSSKDFHPIAFFGGKSPPEDLQDADGLCDWLDERRIVDIEWQKMKQMMESARHLELGDKRGETDDY
ncbi:hypothetical protein GALMADRAFT_239697 [Galerina marginata CBS 339.88]|uniref:DUF4211 domain-containing protein n=1 Tax=Galerina marginata (strain CBS 339.88) TaxID=685588 RepID=A0A067TRM5_GALM3|nr:hypothetical protein GALMADRAFT_239697 [Galerina marginata CBS 339.88]